MMRRGMIFAVVLAVLSSGVGACAMPVTINNGSFSASTVSVEDGAPYALDTNAFQLLGTDNDGSFLIFADSRFLKVTPSAMLGILSAINPQDAFPSISNYAELSKGAQGDAVATLQNSLIALKYLSGDADGDFGSMTEAAVVKAQAALGLKETGAADPLLQMLLASMVSQEQSCAVTGDPMTPFEAIAGKTSVDLDSIVSPDMVLSYDDISGVGMIKNGSVVSYDVETSSDIDQRRFELEFGLRVSQNSSGIVNVMPVVEIHSVGVQRPSMQQIILKSGDERHAIAIKELRNSLIELSAVEDATVMLNESTTQMLSRVADVGELKLRITCKYSSYDIVVPAEILPKIAAIGQAGVTAMQ